MKIAVVGAITEGLASYAYFTARGDDVTICDQNPNLSVPKGAKTRLGDTYLNNLDEFDLVVRTAGIHPSVILDKNPGIGGKITSQLNEFLANCPTKNIIGITGTKGKGTTSTLIAKMLEASGKNVRLGGNIGTPVLDFISTTSVEDWVVLELSSFQLIDCRHSPHIAVCLMVVSEHLDWHEDFEEYIAAKQQLFINQTEADTAIYYSANENSESVASASEGHLIPYMEAPGAFIQNKKMVIDNQEICDVSEIALLGKHNWQNVCAAVTTVWQISQNVEAIRSVIASFKGMEHRLEFVRKLDDVKYYDDSFGTTPETAMVAIEAFEEPKVVILGGSDKNSNYDELAKVVANNNVRSVLLIGEMAEQIQNSLDKVGFKNYVAGGKNINEIVTTARDIAHQGDIVLLSTACASFDMFENYKDRGEKFKKAVQTQA